MIRSWRKLFLKILVVTTVCAGGFLWWRQQLTRGPVRDFVFERDMPFVRDIFERDWFWLVADDPENYDLDFHFARQTWSKNPVYFGKLQIKLLFEGDLPAGLVAYHKETFYSGRVLYLAVHPDFRGKGYGQKLLRHAIKELFDQGCTVIKLLTRIINEPACHIYESFGFVETERYGPFVYYALRRNA